MKALSLMVFLGTAISLNPVRAAEKNNDEYMRIAEKTVLTQVENPGSAWFTDMTIHYDLSGAHHRLVCGTVFTMGGRPSRFIWGEQDPNNALLESAISPLPKYAGLFDTAWHLGCTSPQIRKSKAPKANDKDAWVQVGPDTPDEDAPYRNAAEKLAIAQLKDPNSYRSMDTRVLSVPDFNGHVVCLSVLMKSGGVNRFIWVSARPTLILNEATDDQPQKFTAAWTLSCQ